MSEAQKQQRLAWRHESCRSAGAAARWRPQHDHRNPRLCTDLRQPWKKSCGVLLSCQWANSRQCSQELVTVPWLAMDVATRNLTLAQPCSNRTWLRIKCWRRPKRRHFYGDTVDLSPSRCVRNVKEREASL